ncbi:outer membrane protein assembly factor BamB family protein [Streptomyces sp. NPDC055815]
MRDGIPGAAFGAAAVFLGAGVIGGAWPTGWSALVCALVCGAVGATLLAVRRGGRTAEDAAPAPGLAKEDVTPDAKPARPGRSSLVAAAVVWALAVVAGGFWALAAGDDDTEDTTAGGKAPAKPSATASAALDPRPAVAWTVPGVGQKYDEGVGSWGLGSVVAQGRIDGVFAYDGADGHVRWSVPAPTRAALCAMSRDTEEGVGLVAYGRHDKPCADLRAVRASDGKVLWTRTLAGKGLAAGTLAVGGTTAVGVEDGVVRARSTESGEQRWQRAVPKGCEILAVDADGTRTLLVEQCGQGAKLLALDTRTGAQRWTRELPVESKATAAVVSVSPVVLAVDEADNRGTSAFLGFDDKGAPTATVPLNGPEGVLSAPGEVGDGRAVRPLVLGDLLVTFAESGSIVPTSVVAYSLKDGRKAWQHASEHQTMALAAEPDGRVAVLAYHAGITLLDRATGRVRTRLAPDTAKTPEISIRPLLHPVPGGHVVLNQILMQSEPAAFALR